MIVSCSHREPKHQSKGSDKSTYPPTLHQFPIPHTKQVPQSPSHSHLCIHSDLATELLKYINLTTVAPKITSGYCKSVFQCHNCPTNSLEDIPEQQCHIGSEMVSICYVSYIKYIFISEC